MSGHVRVIAKTKAQLDAISQPEFAGQPEALPWVLYDTQTYTSAATTRLTFFQNTNIDPTITNMEAAGQLPDPQYFEIWYMGLDILIDVSTAATEAGAVDDVAKLILVGRPTFTLTQSNKAFGPFPGSFLHASGGPTGGIASAIATPGSIQFGNNGVFDGGFCVGGSIVLRPKVGWNVSMAWSAAQTLNFGNPLLRFWMSGVLHRRVL